MTDAKSLDIEALLKCLPHRYPFLMVDRVLEFVPGKSLVAIKNVTANEAYFQGHFPGHPVMPGVLILESLAQAGGVLACQSVTADERITILYLVGIEQSRFKQIVRPGDQLRLCVELTKHKRSVWVFATRAEVDGKVVAEAEIMMAEGPKP
jgi:3-hydroxyacyl-[acyl-carrier-protein] dehydratase